MSLDFKDEGKAQESDFNQKPVEASVVDVSGGVHSAVAPYYLEENQLSYLKNANLDRLGMRQRRYGLTSVGSGGTYPNALGFWVNDQKQHQLVAGFADGLAYITNGNNEWSALSASGFSLVWDGFYRAQQGRVYRWYEAPTSATLSESSVFFTTYNPLTGGSHSPLQWVQEDGLIGVNASYHPRACAWWQGRLWIGNLTDVGYSRDTLMWSNIFNGATIDPTNNIGIDVDTGDEIVAIVPTRSAKPRLYVFKKSSIYAFDVVWAGGEVIPSTQNSIDTTNSSILQISADIGCVAPATIVYSSSSADSDIFFLARDGFRSLIRVEQDVAGGASEPISSPIRDVIDRVNWAYAHTSWAVVLEDKVYLALPLDGDTEPNAVMVFDLRQKIWIGEYTCVPRFALAANMGDFGVRLYGAWPTVTEEVLLPSTAVTSAAHVFRLFDSRSYYDPGTADIEYREDSRAFVFGNYGQKKRWDQMEVMLEPAGTNATMSVYAKVDEYDWTLLEHMEVDPRMGYPILPAQLPWTFEQQVPSFHRLSLYDLPPGQKIQIRLVSDSPSAMSIRALRVKALPKEERWE